MCATNRSARFPAQPSRRAAGRWILFLLLLASMPLTSMAQQADAITQFFEKYVEEDGFTSIRLSQRMFSLIAQLDNKDDREVKETASKLSGLHILAADSAELKDGLQLYREAMATLKGKNYESLMSIRDGTERIEFYILDSGTRDKVEELLMLVGGEHTFFLLSITGEISLRQIAKLADSMEIEGMQHLEKLDE